MGLGSIVSSALSFAQSNQNPLNSATGSLTGGLLPAGLNQLGDNFLNGYINYYYSKKLADRQNRQMVDFWNMQNAYNTPAAQMARYDEAGLNPNLIYSQQNTAGSIGTPAVGTFSMPSNSVRTHQFDAVAALQAKYAIENMKEQNLNLQAQNSLIESQRSVADANARRINYETDWLKNRGTSQFDNPVWRGAKSVLRDVGDATSAGFRHAAESLSSSPGRTRYVVPYRMPDVSTAMY